MRFFFATLHIFSRVLLMKTPISVGPVILHKECLCTVHKLPICTPPISLYTPPTGKRKRVRFTVRMESCERGRRGSGLAVQRRGDSSGDVRSSWWCSGDVRRPVLEFLDLTATARPSAFSSSSFCSLLFVFCLCFVL
jgi:hypothetical protein